MSSGFLHSGQHHSGHFSHHHGGDGLSVNTHHSVNHTGQHTSFLQQLLGLHNHHHILHAHAQHNGGVPLGVLPGYKLGLLFEGIKISVGFWYFLLYAFLIGYLCFIHWLRRHDPLADKVIQVQHNINVNSLDSKVVAGVQDAFPIQTKNSQGIYVPGAVNQSRIVNPEFNYSQKSQPQTQSFGYNSFFGNSNSLNNPDPRFGSPISDNTSTVENCQNNNPTIENPMIITNSINNQFNFRNSNFNSIHYRQSSSFRDNSQFNRVNISR